MSHKKVMTGLPAGKALARVVLFDGVAMFIEKIQRIHRHKESHFIPGEVEPASHPCDERLSVLPFLKVKVNKGFMPKKFSCSDVRAQLKTVRHWQGKD